MNQAALEAKGAPTVAAVDGGPLHRRSHHSPFVWHIQLSIWLRAALLLLLLTNAPRECLIVCGAPVHSGWCRVRRGQRMRRTAEGQSHNGQHVGCAEDLRAHNRSVSCGGCSSMRPETPTAEGTAAAGSEQLAEGTVAERLTETRRIDVGTAVSCPSPFFCLCSSPPSPPSAVRCETVGLSSSRFPLQAHTSTTQQQRHAERTNTRTRRYRRQMHQCWVAPFQRPAVPGGEKRVRIQRRVQRARSTTATEEATAAQSAEPRQERSADDTRPVVPSLRIAGVAPASSTAQAVSESLALSLAPSLWPPPLNTCACVGIVSIPSLS
jgi:hypothetical protein